MRHVIDQSFPRVFDCVVQSAPDSNAESETVASGSSSGDQRTSLRSVLPSARFFAGDDIEYTSVADSASEAQPGQLVVYRIGQECPSQLVADALAQGAAGILSEQVLPCPLPQCIVGDVSIALAEVTAGDLDRPDRKLLTVGVVGSAGKTSTALLVASLLRGAGIRTAYQTDLGESDGIVQATGNDPVLDHAALVEWIGEAADCGCNAAIIELHDETVRHGGYDAVRFDLLIVTGRRETKTDFGESSLHCAMERLTSTGVVIAPADDPAIMRVIHDSGVRTVTYGVKRAADVTAKIIEQSSGMTTLLMSHDRTTAVMETTLCGAAMAGNHAAAAAAGLLIAQPLHEVVERLGSLRMIPGRGQSLSQFGNATVVLDRGGSPDRAGETLRTYRSMKGAGRLWCILAIEADDAPETLARYGQLLERFADTAIVTSTSDSKSQFLASSHAVLDGVERCAAMRLVADQQRAIQWAMSEARATDTILVVGGLSGNSAHQRRAEIERVQAWVESEHQNRLPHDASETTAGEPNVLNIADYRE